MNALTAVALVLLAPLLQGTMQRIRARLSRRPGPSVFQPYRDLRKLWSKPATATANSSLLVLAAPGVALGAAIAFALLVPSLDAVALVLVLALGRFILVLAALDSRSGFAGMAASRDMLFAALTEAPLIAAVASAAIPGGPIAHLLAAGALVLVMLYETARIPVDNQETHYELTMVHEGLSLEYSGWQLALLHAAGYVRQAAFFVLASLLMPGQGVARAGWFVLFVLLIALVERRFAKLRLFQVPQLFASAMLLSIASIGLSIAGLNA